MLTLLGSALGLFSSAIPKMMDMWQDKNDKIHELALLKAQAEIKLDETAIEANIREVESLHRHDASFKGSTWVENTRAMVRPIMAYSFMLLFFIVEIVAFMSLVNAGTGAGVALQQIWDDEVMSLWATILAFYFGGRQFKSK